MINKFLGGFMFMAGLYLLFQICRQKPSPETIIVVFTACFVGGCAMVLVFK